MRNLGVTWSMIMICDFNSFRGVTKQYFYYYKNMNYYTQVVLLNWVSGLIKQNYTYAYALKQWTSGTYYNLNRYLQ